MSPNQCFKAFKNVYIIILAALDFLDGLEFAFLLVSSVKLALKFYSDSNKQLSAQSSVPKCPVFFFPFSAESRISDTLLYPGELCLVSFIFSWFIAVLRPVKKLAMPPKPKQC